jgi:hypothetical protein
MYYDITIGPKWFEIICNRAGELYSSSRTLESWNISNYARVLKFTDELSLINVRRFWEYYESMSKLSPRALGRLAKTFMSDFRKPFGTPGTKGMVMTCYRSLGPLFGEGREILGYLLDSLARTGNLGARRDTTARTYVNPLFAYSSIADERCALPAGMNPLSGFQVTSALVDTLAPVSEGLSAYSNTLTAEEKAIRVVTYTKDQFKARCSAFQNSPSVTIYHYNDEVVRICYSLQSRLDSSVANIYD